MKDIIKNTYPKKNKVRNFDTRATSSHASTHSACARVPMNEDEGKGSIFSNVTPRIRHYIKKEKGGEEESISSTMDNSVSMSANEKIDVYTIDSSSCFNLTIKDLLKYIIGVFPLLNTIIGNIYELFDAATDDIIVISLFYYINGIIASPFLLLLVLPIYYLCKNGKLTRKFILLPVFFFLFIRLNMLFYAIIATTSLNDAIFILSGYNYHNFIHTIAIAISLIMLIYRSQRASINGASPMRST